MYQSQRTGVNFFARVEAVRGQHMAHGTWHMAHGAILHITNSLSHKPKTTTERETLEQHSIIEEHEKVCILYRFSNMYGCRTHDYHLLYLRL